MFYLIVGCGRVGSTLAKLLLAESHEVTVVDENPNAFRRLGSSFGGNVVLGTGIDSDLLTRAEIERADGFVAVTDGDNRNVMAALIAKRMFGVKKIVARIYDPPRGQLYRELGIETVCPTTIGAKIVRDKLMHMPFASLPSFDFGKLSSLAVTVDERQAGMTVGSIEQDGRIRIGAIRRGPSVTVAQSSDILAIGEEIHAIVAPEALTEFAGRFASNAVPIEVVA
jgi:trk system potassium uptake protein TrkA